MKEILFQIRWHLHLLKESIFQTKWKLQWEPRRAKFEDIGYDAWIKSPMDLTDEPIITNPKVWKAMMEETQSFIDAPKAVWK